MPSEQNRVYIENEDEAPDDALIRESDNGNLYYTPSDRGRNNHTGGNKTNELLEQSGPELTPKPGEESEDTEKSEEDTFGKPFEGPNGQGPFDSLEDCARQMEGEVDDPEGWCAWAENKARKSEGANKVYVGSEDEAPEDVTVKEDDTGLFYRQQTAWESRDMHYPEDTEEEIEEDTDVELPDSETATDEGVPSEADAEDEEEELHDESHEQFGGPDED